MDSVPSVQPAGGLLSLWNNSAFHVERRIKGHSFLFLDGRWVSEDHRLFIVNVYAPCDLAGKEWKCALGEDGVGYVGLKKRPEVEKRNL